MPRTEGSAFEELAKSTACFLHQFFEPFVPILNSLSSFAKLYWVFLGI